MTESLMNLSNINKEKIINTKVNLEKFTMAIFTGQPT